MSNNHSLFDLDRFIKAQEADYDIALRELRQGQKVSHWIWYVFPQLAELGYSYRAKYYGLDSLEEARAYMDQPVLGPRYLTCVEALLQHQDKQIADIMGGEVDVKKLNSSLTLMLAAGGGGRIERTLDHFYRGISCAKTRELLRQN